MNFIFKSILVVLTLFSLTSKVFADCWYDSEGRYVCEQPQFDSSVTPLPRHNQPDNLPRNCYVDVWDKLICN